MYVFKGKLFALLIFFLFGKSLSSHSGEPKKVAVDLMSLSPAITYTTDMYIYISKKADAKMLGEDSSLTPVCFSLIKLKQSPSNKAP